MFCSDDSDQKQSEDQAEINKNIEKKDDNK